MYELRLYYSKFLFHLGPGLAVRVICADEPFMDKFFAETSVLVKVIIEYANSVEKVSSIKANTIFVSTEL